jgi:hypothetical protein
MTYISTGPILVLPSLITGHFSPHSLPFHTEEGCRITSPDAAFFIAPSRVSQISLSSFINLIKPTNTLCPRKTIIVNIL